MSMMSNIFESLNEKYRNKYNTTKKADEIINKVNQGQNVSITRPTSQRTFTKGQQGRNLKGQFTKRQYTEGGVEIGDTTALHQNKDYAKTAERPSSAIASLKYNPTTEVATVDFVNGSHPYEYNVPPTEIQNFVEADSKGRYVQDNWNHNPEYRMPGY